MPNLRVIPGGRSTQERFETLIRKHYDVLYRTAYRMTRSVQDAEDLVQEVCVRAYPRLAELETLEQPRGWLMCVMYRLFVDMSRRYERTHVSSLETMAVDLTSIDPGPAEETERLLRKARFDRAWSRLDKEQRALLALHDLEGYSLAEICGMTGLKEGTLKSRLHRARMRLGKLMRMEESATAFLSGAGGVK